MILTARGAGLAVRGWLETAYYLLGADFTASSDIGAMSYMANMGGWGILDYAVNFSDSPYDWLQLGYASYLSSWSLMNTGRPDTNYGFWFPGQRKRWRGGMAIYDREGRPCLDSQRRSERSLAL
jgi:hypothetical protein